MPRYKSLPKAKVKKTDEFVSAVDHAIHFIGRYKGVVLITVLAAVVFGVGYLIFQQKRENDLEALNQLLFEAKESKENPADSFKPVFERYGRYSLAQAVRLFLVDWYISQGTTDKALEELVIASEKAPAMLTPLIKFSRAQLLWQMEKPDEAIKYINEVENEANGAMSGYLKLLKGQILENQGKKEEARAVYQEIFESETEDPILRKKVEAQLVRLYLSS